MKGKRSKRKIAGFLVAAAILAAYVASYSALGVHYNRGDRFARVLPGLYELHEREFAFDPWFYVPVACFEYELQLNGGRTVVRLSERNGRDAAAIYHIGPKIHY